MLISNEFVVESNRYGYIIYNHVSVVMWVANVKYNILHIIFECILIAMNEKFL